MTQKDSFNSSYIFQKIGEFKTKSGERAPDICKPNGHHRKRISGQIEAQSLECATWWKYMNISEPNHKRAKGGQKEEMDIPDKEGSLRAAK